ncbi:MAG: hypothetical protein Q8Q89_04720 [bacterium]|nr:hypothetical protein [bacterium]
MTYFWYGLTLYLLLAVPCFFLCYTYDIHRRGRVPSVCIHTSGGFWKFVAIFLRQGFGLFIHDYSRVHCPWSWAISKKHRLADMRKFLGPEGKNHERFGHIKDIDCDAPKTQELIARYCYTTRTKFWLNGLKHFLIAPIPGLFVVVLLVLDDRIVD